MKTLITLFLLTFQIQAFAQTEDSLLLDSQQSQNQPEKYTKYTLENDALKILVFKIDYGEPAINPLHFNIYYQCKSNNKYLKLERTFNNTEEKSSSYCDHDSFHLGTLEGEGSKEFLVLPMKKDVNSSCPEKSNSIESFPLSEMNEKCS